MQVLNRGSCSSTNNLLFLPLPGRVSRSLGHRCAIRPPRYLCRKSCRVGGVDIRVIHFTKALCVHEDAATIIGVLK